MRRLSLEPYGAVAYMATDPSSWRALARKLSFLDKETPLPAGQVTFAAFHPSDGGIPTPVFAIWIDVEQHAGDMGQLVNTCAHEADHAARDLLDHIGHHPHGADEPSAYLVGAITQWLYEGVTA